MTIQNRLIIFTVKLVQKLVRLLGKGEGTALPGLLVEKFSPALFASYSKQIHKVILVTGTNGKTTTQKAITSILEHSGKKVLANSSGSNMRRGLLSLFVNKSSLSGKLDYEYAVLEIEEATMPRVAKELNPKIIVVTNLYRDQLDAYGEVDRTKNMIRQAIELVPKAEVIINGDDPQLSDLVHLAKNKVSRYAIAPEYLLDFKYEGDKCEREDKPDYLAENIKVAGDLGTKFMVAQTLYAFASPGIYNVYNALAAIAVGLSLGMSSKDIENGLLLMKVAFGRGELIEKDGIAYRLLLTKNPAGLNLVLDLLANVKNPKIVFLLNDKIADGRDVSWIWDAEFEKLLKVEPELIMVGGTRAEELLLRLKYVYGNVTQIAPECYIFGDKLRVYLEPSIKKLIKLIKQDELGDHFYVVPTYTAMLALRHNLLGRALDE